MARKGKFSQPRGPIRPDLDMAQTESLSDFRNPTEDASTAEPPVANPVTEEPVLASNRLFASDKDTSEEVTFSENGRFSFKNKKTILISLCAVAATVLVALILTVSFLLRGGSDDELILNNVTVAGVNLGGMTQNEAIRVLRAATDRTYTEQDMVVVLPDRTITFSPAATGAKLDVEAAVEAAYLYGRSGTRAEQEAAKAQSLTGVHHIALLPYLQLNTAYIRQELESYCASFSSSYVPSSATLTGDMPALEGDQFNADAPCQTLVLNPGVSGRGMDAEELYNAVVDAYSFNTFRVEMDSVNLSQEPEALDLQALLAEYGREPVSATVDSETRQIIPETWGYTFDVEKAQTLLDAAEPGVEVSVPMEYVEPEYTTQTLFRDVLGACETPHTADENRNTNLRLVCEAIDGMILMPGDTFDYNEAVGQRTAEKGYKAAAAYSSGQTVKEIGGGICQVSSTLYLAALRADLEIVSRTEHSYISSYIPYGMDATVSWGGPEFRFLNNYDHPIRIDAQVADGYVKINLMSVDERDYYVEVEYNILAWENYETVYEEYAPDNEKGYKNGDVITTPYTGCTVRTYRCRYSKSTDELLSRVEETRSKYKKRDEVIAKIVEPTTPSESTTPTPEPTESETVAPAPQPTDPPTPPADSDES